MMAQQLLCLLQWSIQEMKMLELEGQTVKVSSASFEVSLVERFFYWGTATRCQWHYGAPEQKHSVSVAGMGVSTCGCQQGLL